MNWEVIARRIAKEVLTEGFCIHDFKIIHSRKNVHLQVYLDNTKNTSGSPTVAECASYLRIYRSRLEDFIQTQSEESSLSKKHTIEVSSPSAEREIKVPDELERFSASFMKVQYFEKKNRVQCSEVLFFRGFEGSSQLLWQIADVKFNKQQGKSKKNKVNPIFKIPLQEIRQVNLFVDLNTGVTK